MTAVRCNETRRPNGTTFRRASRPKMMPAGARRNPGKTLAPRHAAKKASSSSRKQQPIKYHVL
jgi:hypothetical protein